MKLVDRYGRKHSYLRISLTDKCNLNCIYCNPILELKKNMRHNEMLRYEEIIKLVEIFVSKLEFRKIRLTGGEPFIKKNFESLLDGLKKVKRVYPFELSATTNGTLLNGNMSKLKSDGIDRLNISLDSLDRDNFKKITGKDELATVLHAIKAAELCGYRNIKLNTVVIRGVNENELIDFVDFIADTLINIRFIEYMPFSNNIYDVNKLIGADEMKGIISKKYKLIELQARDGVAKDYRIDGHSGIVSFISPVSEHFCDSCNRLRLTAIGELKLCLFSSNESSLNLRDVLRARLSDDDIVELINQFISIKEFKHPDLEELIHLRNNQMISIGG